MFDYKLEKSIRRTISVTVLYNGQIVVRAPLYMPENDIDDFVNKKAVWIERKVKEAKQKSAHVPVLKDGERIYLCGKNYELKISGDVKRVRRLGEFLILPADNSVLAFRNFIKREFEPYIKQKTLSFAELFGFKVNKISVGSATKRWGSCSSSKNIIFNFRLALVPECAIDYVVIHELCHTKQLNHGKGFYSLLSHCMPYYKINEAVLSEYGAVCSCLI